MGQILPFLIGFLHRPYNTLALPCECVITVRPIPRGHSPVCPVFNVGILWPNGWMDQDDTWYGGRPRRHRVI